MASKPYVVIDSDIIGSSVWSEDPATKVVWFTLLILCDTDGYVGISLPGLADTARVTLDECKRALEKFESPDPYSRTQDHEGRRIAKAERGWKILNFSDNLDRLKSARKRSSERVRRHRDKKALTNLFGNAESVPVTLQAAQGIGSREYKETDIREVVERIFAYWQKTMGHTNALMTPKRLKNIKDRLEQGYPEDQIKRAIDGCKSSDFHMGNNERKTKYNDIELICRSGEKLEAFITKANLADGDAQSKRDALHNNTETPYISPTRRLSDGTIVFDPSVALQISPGSTNGAEVRGVPTDEKKSEHRGS